VPQGAGSATPTVQNAARSRPASAAFRCFEAARAPWVDTDELKPKARRGACAISSCNSTAGRAQREVTTHTELAEIVLDESGYTEMWQKRSLRGRPPAGWRT